MNLGFAILPAVIILVIGIGAKPVQSHFGDFHSEKDIWVGGKEECVEAAHCELTLEGIKSHYREYPHDKNGIPLLKKCLKFITKCGRGGRIKTEACKHQKEKCQVIITILVRDDFASVLDPTFFGSCNPKNYFIFYKPNYKSWPSIEIDVSPKTKKSCFSKLFIETKFEQLARSREMSNQDPDQEKREHDEM